MPSNTEKLGLYKANPATDGDLTFNIDLMLNDNWDKLDAAVKRLEDTPSLPAAEKGAAGGVATLDGSGKVPAAQLPEMDYDPAGSAQAVETELAAHTADMGNPHGVTAAQVGAAEAGHTHADYAPLLSPEFAGTPKAPAAGTDYAAYRIRNIAIVSAAPSGAIGNGQIVGVYQ